MKQVDFYEEHEVHVVLGQTEDNIVSIYDGNLDQGVALVTRNQVEFVVEALQRWLDDGGKNV